MNFTNLARLTGQKAPRLLLPPPPHLWNHRNVSSFLLFDMDARHPDPGPYVFAGSMSPTKLFCHPLAQTFPTGGWGSETCLLWVPEQLLCKNFNLFSFHLLRLVSSDKSFTVTS